MKQLAQWNCHLTLTSSIIHHFKWVRNSLIFVSEMGHSIKYPHPPIEVLSISPPRKKTFDPLGKEDQSADTLPLQDLFKEQLPPRKWPLKTPLPLRNPGPSIRGGGCAKKKNSWPNETRSSGPVAIHLSLRNFRTSAGNFGWLDRTYR